MASAKVKIDLSNGLIELEGESEFVSNYLDKLMPIIESRSRISNVISANTAFNDTPDGADTESEAAEKPIPENTKKKRRLSKRPPAGASCRDRILILKGDGFFKEHRTASDIVSGLGKKGWTHKGNQVGAALTTMFNSGEIQRTKATDSSGFSYYWDRH